jgi:uncharacterized membrane protein YeaQ/YmgE (transglycosylase-associated protein family)
LGDRVGARAARRKAVMLNVVGACIVAALSAGWLAGYIIRDGGFGLKSDLALGFIGSLVLSVFLLGLSAGLVDSAVVAVIGAGGGIVLQRLFWNTEPSRALGREVR